MSNKKKRELAKQLYLHTQKTQKDIAEQVGVTQKTMSKWSTEWRQLKAASESTPEKTRDRLYNQMMRILDQAEDEERQLTDSESDKIAKLNKAIESVKKGIGLSDYIQAFMDFNDYLLRKDPALAGKFVIHQEHFLNIKANGE